ncbi:hypothetical protein [Streptomyces sp. NPDC001880]
MLWRSVEAENTRPTFLVASAVRVSIWESGTEFFFAAAKGRGDSEIFMAVLEGSFRITEKSSQFLYDHSSRRHDFTPRTRLTHRSDPSFTPMQYRTYSSGPNSPHHAE